VCCAGSGRTAACCVMACSETATRAKPLAPAGLQGKEKKKHEHTQTYGRSTTTNQSYGSKSRKLKAERNSNSTDRPESDPIRSGTDGEATITRPAPPSPLGRPTQLFFSLAKGRGECIRSGCAYLVATAVRVPLASRFSAGAAADCHRRFLCLKQHQQRRRPILMGLQTKCLLHSAKNQAGCSNLHFTTPSSSIQHFGTSGAS
jgi:hypothetical protein